MGGHGSGGLFGPTLGSLSAPLPVEIAHKSPVGKKDERIISNPVVDAVRTGSASKLDQNHDFPNVVDNYASYAHRFVLVGGDGKARLLFQLKGSYNGVPGIFEWIVDPNPKLGVTHRRFIGGGKITGRPNQTVRKARG